MQKVTQADLILKATRDLNKAISGIQSDAPSDYVYAVHKLHRVLLKETPSKTTKCPCAPNQPVEKSTTKIAEKESAQPAQSPQSPAKEPTLPKIPYVTDGEYLDDDESVNGKDKNNYEVNKPPLPRYNLRMCANNSINSIIFKETPTVQQTTHDPVHQGRYSIATKTMQIKEGWQWMMKLEKR
eukprot:6725597-Ditylum_brightwellii.AAC.1